MSILGDITNTLTGGQNSAAQGNEQKALEGINDINAPTTAELSIPQLQQYVVAGVMTPAQAIAYLQNSNAYSNIQLDPQSMEAEYQALSELQNVAQTGGNDAESKLAMQQALDTSTAALRGEEGANTLQAEQRGVAPGLAVEAANEADIGNNANALFGADQQAAAAAEQRQLAALSGVGSQAGNIVGQTEGLAENTAAAQNAIQQFNAQNQTNVSEANAGRQQQANAANFENTQNVSNQNTGQNNQRTIYNATQAPQQAYQDALQKAEAAAGESNTLANTQIGIGQQNAATAAAGLNFLMGQGDPLSQGANGISGTDAVNSGAGSTPTGANANPANYGIGMDNGGLVQPAAKLAPLAEMFMSHGGETSNQGPKLDMKKGGIVPGKPVVPGDSPKNDIIPARVGSKPLRLSPGEVVLPRTIAANPSPDRVQNFLSSLPKYHKMMPKEQQVHPKDIANVLQALSHLRGGNSNAI